MIDLSSELQSAAEADVIGLAVIGADRTVRQRMGRLVEWLPAVGADSCQCMLLTGMESELTALAGGKQDMIVLPGVRGVAAWLDNPMTVIVRWDNDQSHYVVVAVPDFGSRETEILLESERRARRLTEQQLEAASSEVRFASLARTRLRLARDLHDTLAHSIVALLTQIRLTRHFLASDPARVSEGLATAEEAAISGLARARDAIARLRTSDMFDLKPDIEGMLSDFADQTGIEVSVQIGDEARDGVRRHGSTIRRILGEALYNIKSHAKARQVEFRALEEGAPAGGKLIVEIRDDGCGFDPSAHKAGHFGLTGMAEFAELAGGECTVESIRGKGTTVRISLPLIDLPQPQSSNASVPVRRAVGRSAG